MSLRSDEKNDFNNAKIPFSSLGSTNQSKTDNLKHSLELESM